MSVDYARIQGHDVYSREGEKIGKVQEIYSDNKTGRPVFATVRTGLFGTKSSFVPLAEATQAGDDLAVPYSKEQVKQAPNLEPDADLSVNEEQELFSYYHMSEGTPAGDDARSTGGSAQPPAGRADAAGIGGGVGQARPGVAAGRTQTADAAGRTGAAGREQGRDVSGPTTDDAMTRSEERLHTGRETVETGRARLRKYVVTETVTQTVPVSHEEVRVEREPITEANRGAATTGPEISEEEHEVVLHAERPITAKETVPVERVRLETGEVRGEATVSEDVRKERIEFDEEKGDEEKGSDR